MHPTVRDLLHGLKWVLCFLAFVIYIAALGDAFYYFLIFLMVPGVALYEHMLPALLLFLQTLTPVADVFFHDVLRALAVFLVSLSLPVSLFLCLKLVLLPLYLTLVRLVF